ncbi:hypothetical protein JMN10_14900 [Capnocytophaga genosp. AHN8471]|uniref:GLPGLI family protein n=1 Tax=Capnocytophaga genosp. AHN8471 TaxID=327574 RepID=A0ABS1Z0H1_9FLAO|nr:hypothetical protein [Capnocytophaga genosp. AHN8471]MBM0652022.1 hypothetical protein [Capnocytophaga genosp. AHN8471]MBM0663452.1 hypothetical protein [Capnocytophaga genosp. AHN8471]
MKKLITISCLLLVNLSNAQNIYELKIDKKMDKNNRPTIDSGFDILHLEEYKDYLIKDPDNIDKDVYEKKTSSGKIQIEGGYGNDYTYEKYFNNSSYCIFKVYDAKTLKIKRKCLLTRPVDIFLGKEYRYDSNATLIKTIDHDKGWNFSYEDVINYLYEHIEDEVEIPISSIKKRVYQNRNYWQVETNTMFWKNNHFLRIDGNTGEILCHLILYAEENAPAINVLKTIVPNKIDKLPPEENKYLHWIDENGKKYQTPDTRRKVNGISYTEEEWKAYEEEQRQRYQKNKGKSWWERLFS